MDADTPPTDTPRHQPDCPLRAVPLDVASCLCGRAAPPTDTPPGGEREGVAYVPQRESWDCGVASLAMAAGVNYEAALAVVPQSQRGDLLHTVHFTQWLGALGCAVRKTYAEQDDLRGIRLLCHQGHFVVMRPDGMVNDPARGEGLPRYFYRNPFDVWEVHRPASLSRPAVPSEAMVEAFPLTLSDGSVVTREVEDARVGGTVFYRRTKPNELIVESYDWLHCITADDCGADHDRLKAAALRAARTEGE